MPRKLLLFLCALALSALTMAQTTEPPSSARKGGPGMLTRQAQAMREAAQQFVGRWHTEEIFEKNEMMPAGGSGRGTATDRLGQGDLYIISNYESIQKPTGKFSGHGVMWYDPNANGYRAIWCDSMAQNGCDDMGAGKWNDQHTELVFEGDSEMMGQTFHFRNTYTDLTPNSFTFVMEAGPSASQLQKFGTIKYTRIGSIPRNLLPKSNSKVKK
jgi:uncharacterized protein DUF1579